MSRLFSLWAFTAWARASSLILFPVNFSRVPDEDSQYVLHKFHGRIVGNMRNIQKVKIGQFQIVAPYIGGPVNAVALMRQDETVKEIVFPLSLPCQKHCAQRDRLSSPCKHRLS